MNTNAKEPALTVGDFVAAAYRDMGSRRAKGFVRLALNARLVVYRWQQRFVVSEEEHDNPSLNIKRE